METRTVLFEKTVTSFWHPLSYDECKNIGLRNKNSIYYTYSNKFFVISNFSFKEFKSLAPFKGERTMIVFYKQVQFENIEHIKQLDSAKLWGLY